MSARTAPPDMPAFHGYIETTGDALRVIWAAHRGQVSRLSRRLNETERKRMIRSGTVFVFSVDESGIKRWTDGLMWSPSRIVGNFLVYRELSERGLTRGSKRRPPEGDAPYPREGVTNAPTPTDQPTFKVDGLTKKTITIKVGRNSDMHLIAYYTQNDLSNGVLQRPTMDPTIMAISLSASNFQLTNLRNPPRITVTEDGKTRIDDEVENEAPSSSVAHQYPRVSLLSSSNEVQGFQRAPNREFTPSRRLSDSGPSSERHPEPLSTFFGHPASYTSGGQTDSASEGVVRQRSNTIGVDPRPSVYQPSMPSWSTPANALNWPQITRTSEIGAYGNGTREQSYQYNTSSRVLQDEPTVVHGQDAPSWNEHNHQSNDFREVGRLTQQIGSSSNRPFHHPSLSPSPMSPSALEHNYNNYSQQSSLYGMAPPVDMLTSNESLAGQPTSPTLHTPYSSAPSYTLATATAQNRYDRREVNHRIVRSHQYAG